MMSIFDQGARLVPDIVTEAEEQRILLRIADAPWLTDLSRRVQHYGYRYDYRARNSGQHLSAPAFPRWASAIADRLLPLFGDRRPEQCIVNEYRPGQGIGMHADHASFGRGGGVAFAGRRLGRCTSGPAASAPMCATGWRPTRSSRFRAARPSSCAAKRGRAGCTVSIPPPARARPRPASPRRSAPSSDSRPHRSHPCRRQGRPLPGRHRGRRQQERLRGALRGVNGEGIERDLTGSATIVINQDE